MSPKEQRRKGAARERLAAQRQQQAQAVRRRRQTNFGIAAVVVVVAVLIIGYAWWASSNDNNAPETATLPALVSEQGGGVVIGEGEVAVDTWIDFQCPACKQFELSNEAVLQQSVKSGEITLTVHPLSFLDDNLNNGSSKLAANAFGCAADVGEQEALDFSLAVYEAQPPENPGTEAWSADDLISLGNDVGLEGSTWESCVQDGTYDEWVQQVAASRIDAGITQTPTIFIDGEQFDPRGDFEAAIQQATGP